MMARPRIRSHHQLLVFSANMTLGWRVTRRIDFASGERQVERGELQRVFDEFHVHIGYQPVRELQTDRDLPSRQSSSSISVGEMEVNAGLDGFSRTEGLNEHRRVERMSRGLAPEDYIERVMEKVRLWKQ